LTPDVARRTAKAVEDYPHSKTLTRLPSPSRLFALCHRLAIRNGHCYSLLGRCPRLHYGRAVGAERPRATGRFIGSLRRSSRSRRDVMSYASVFGTYGFARNAVSFEIAQDTMALSGISRDPSQAQDDSVRGAVLAPATGLLRKRQRTAALQSASSRRPHSKTLRAGRTCQ